MAFAVTCDHIKIACWKDDPAKEFSRTWQGGYHRVHLHQLRLMIPSMRSMPLTNAKRMLLSLLAGGSLWIEQSEIIIHGQSAVEPGPVYAELELNIQIEDSEQIF